MSDDIPLIFAEDTGTPSAVFLSATSPAHMQQYAQAGWRVYAAAGFQSPRPITLADIPAQTGDDFAQPSVVSCEGPHWAGGQDIVKLGNLVRVKRWQPRVLKLNYAFSDVPADQIRTVAEELGSMGYIVLAAHWRDDNTMRVRSLNRIERLAMLQPPEWNRLNFIACADERMAHLILRVGRLHAGQEQRIAQLRVSEAIRNEHIARLEAALVKAQASPHFRLQQA